MTARRKRGSLAAAMLCAAVAGCHTVPARISADPSPGTTGRRSRIALAHALPRMDGGHLTGSVVEVSYGPGDSSPPHSHPCPVIGYVVEGTLRMRLEGEQEATYRAGDSFYEAPGGVHLVSANASSTGPAKLIAYFVCDRDVPLSVAVPETRASGGQRP